jgi:hypothetical protein
VIDDLPIDADAIVETVEIANTCQPGTSRNSAAGLAVALAGSAPVTPANTAPSVAGASAGDARTTEAVAAIARAAGQGIRRTAAR